MVEWDTLCPRCIYHLCTSDTNAKADWENKCKLTAREVKDWVRGTVEIEYVNCSEYIKEHGRCKNFKPKSRFDSSLDKNERMYIN